MEYDTIQLKCPGESMNLFMGELQRGFCMEARAGTVYEFLAETCRMSDEYIAEKIKTVFINGGPVDDIYNTEIKEGDTCAVSGAMPGLVGAMMRMGSPYASMRESITVKPGKSALSGRSIFVKLKLFNMVLSEKGPCFLAGGILLERERVNDLFVNHGGEIFPRCREVLINGSAVEDNRITAGRISGMGKTVMLKVAIDD